MKKFLRPMTQILIVFFLLALYGQKGWSAEENDASQSTEKVDVDSVKEKYWARGEKIDLGVVQNRTYQKSRKWELGLFGGFTSTDPFIDVYNTGGTFGFHFNEYLGAELVGFKYFSKDSSASQTFKETRGGLTNTNNPNAFLGAEAVGSVLYGKISLLGWKIIHYDFHLLAGAGLSLTETGNYPTGILGVGQQFYLNNSFSLRVDYRLMPYKENIKEEVIPSRIGQVVGSRMNWSNSLTIGVTFMFGSGKQDEK